MAYYFDGKAWESTDHSAAFWVPFSRRAT